MKIIYKDGHVDECPQDQELHVIRHTAAHIMAQAIKRLYPEADFAFGPATENGFYYDVDLGDTKLTDDDLANIEKEMRKICKENLAIKPFILPRDEAVKLMEERQEHYKIEHMADLADETEFSFFQQGEYVDMCIGPHLTYTKALKAFKITQQSGAYWKNDKENKMLTRINGVAFHNQEELEAWEKEQQEARERDHRKIGKEMGLFMTDDLVGRGLPMFLPAGYTVWQELENYIKEKERARGYLHVMTPCIGTVNLYKTSGHWDHYRENMFPAMEMEGESYVLRPMNCPHHMMIYANRPHSYRDLPMRIGEIAHDFRYESSGTLKGIERGRHFCQNDAHLFCTPEQIKSEVADVCNLIFETYKDFNITDYRCVLSLRDPADKKKYHDDDAMWNHAEQALREVLTELGIHFTEEIGEAAFYGPKLDVNVKPAVGAEYTLSTCQLDFCLPAKFHLTYVDKDGTEKTPVVLHLDHGQSVEQVVKALCAGFTSVMIDGSKLSFEDNIAVTQEVVRIANAAGASVEAELGAILGSEDNISHDDSKPFLVRVQDVIDFTAAVKVDALAVGIGNAHGLYKGRPNLDFQRLQEVRDVTDVPLVLHGGSGIPDDMIQTAIEIGIRKINVATEIRMAYVEGLLSGSANGDYYEMVKAGKASVKARAKSKIDLFLRK